MHIRHTHTELQFYLFHLLVENINLTKCKIYVM